MNKSPAFRLYASDFDMDTNTWELEEIGLYFRLLMSQWVNGPLPNDPQKLSKIARTSVKKFNYLFENIRHKFKLNGDRKLFNQRLEDEREKQTNYMKFQQESGKKGAFVRWNKRGDPNGDPNGENMARAMKTKTTPSSDIHL